LGHKIRDIEGGLYFKKETIKLLSDASRDIKTQHVCAEFWALHIIGAYEDITQSDNDHRRGILAGNDLAGTAGTATEDDCGGSAYIFCETIRDGRDPNNIPTNGEVSIFTVLLREVLHESIHYFVGTHKRGVPDEGCMVQGIATTSSADAFVLTKTHILKIQKTIRPSCTDEESNTDNQK
jgi:hypothetical protein